MDNLNSIPHVLESILFNEPLVITGGHLIDDSHSDHDKYRNNDDDDDDDDFVLWDAQRAGSVISPSGSTGDSETSQCISSSSMEEEDPSCASLLAEELLYYEYGHRHYDTVEHHVRGNEHGDGNGDFEMRQILSVDSDEGSHLMPMAQLQHDMQLDVDHCFSDSFLNSLDNPRFDDKSMNLLQTLIDDVHTTCDENDDSCGSSRSSRSSSDSGRISSRSSDRSSSFDETESSSSGDSDYHTNEDASDDSGTKKRKRTHNKNTILQEIADEANKLALKQSRATELLDELEKNPKMDEREKRRQRRLVKNRESAQASRERRKLYVQSLEQRVTDLTIRTEELENQMADMEYMNDLLREKIKRLEKGESTDDMPDLGCSTKRRRRDTHSHEETSDDQENQRRLPKTPISLPDVANENQLATMMNPFDPSFWALMMGFRNDRDGQQQQKSSDDSQISSAPLAGRNVVMFIVLFCLAFMVSCPDMDQQHTLDPSGISGVMQQTEGENTVTGNRYIGRNILTVRSDDRTIRIKFLTKACSNLDKLNDGQRSMIQEQFNERMVILSQSWMKNYTGHHDNEEEEEDKIAFQFDKESNELSVSMDRPLNNNAHNKKSRSERTSKHRKMNHTIHGDGGGNGSGRTLSRTFFDTICDMVDKLGESTS